MGEKGGLGLPMLAQPPSFQASPSVLFQDYILDQFKFKSIDGDLVGIVGD